MATSPPDLSKLRIDRDATPIRRRRRRRWVWLVIVAVLIAVGSGADAVTGAIAGGVLSLAGFVVWAWLTIRGVAENGQSIAKKMLAIRVVRSDGSPATLGRIFWLRNVVNTLISIVPFYFLIDFLFIFAEDRQCLHDKIADTIVVKA